MRGACPEELAKPSPSSAAPGWAALGKHRLSMSWPEEGPHPRLLRLLSMPKRRESEGLRGINERARAQPRSLKRVSASRGVKSRFKQPPPKALETAKLQHGLSKYVLHNKYQHKN